MKRPIGLLKNLENGVRNHMNAERVKNPLVFGTRHPEVLTIDEVAAILRCSIDRVRRIDRKALPAHAGAGQQSLYLYDEVIAYVRNQSARNYNLSILNKKIGGKPIEPKPAYNVVEFNAEAALAKLREK